MYTEHKRILSRSDCAIPLAVNSCYTLKCDLDCTRGIFSKGTVIRIASICEAFGDYVYTFESDGVTDTYCLEPGKTLSSVFEYNKECTDACYAIERSFDTVKDRFEASVFCLCGILVMLSTFAIIYGVLFHTGITIMVGVLTFLASIICPLRSPACEYAYIDARMQAKITEALKGGNNVSEV